MTDNEIVKAMVCCMNDKPCAENNCPFYRTVCENDLHAIERYALDLINRQKAEIDNLNIELQAMRGAANSYKAEIERLEKGSLKEAMTFNSKTISNIRAEAHKEFAKELNNKGMLPHEINDDYAVGLKTIDNCLKELVGEDDG